MAKPKRGETIELVVDDLAFGGEGVGRVDGYVVFVRGGLPGDRLRVRLSETRARYGRGVLEAVLAPSPDRVELTSPAESAVVHLEEELKRIKAQLRTTIEQYETQTEEAKAANEELQAMNEELRSAAEELETSKEELQSVNEELTTLNHEGHEGYEEHEDEYVS